MMISNLLTVSCVYSPSPRCRSIFLPDPRSCLSL